MQVLPLRASVTTITVLTVGLAGLVALVTRGIAEVSSVEKLLLYCSPHVPGAAGGSARLRLGV